MSCLCFPFELLLGVAGIIALAAGRLGLGRTGSLVLEGRAARFAGAVLVAPLMAGFIGTAAEVVALFAAPDQYGGISVVLLIGRGLILAAGFVTFIIIGVASGRNPRHRARESTRRDEMEID
jgi:hypothetical protein